MNIRYIKGHSYFPNITLWPRYSLSHRNPREWENRFSPFYVSTVGQNAIFHVTVVRAGKEEIIKHIAYTLLWQNPRTPFSGFLKGAAPRLVVPLQPPPKNHWLVAQWAKVISLSIFLLVKNCAQQLIWTHFIFKNFKYTRRLLFPSSKSFSLSLVRAELYNSIIVTYNGRLSRCWESGSDGIDFITNYNEAGFDSEICVHWCSTFTKSIITSKKIRGKTNVGFKRARMVAYM